MDYNCCIFFVACSTNETQFTTTGNIEDLPDGQVKLLKIADGELNAVDSTESLAGVFRFSGNIESPELYVLKCADQRLHLKTKLPIHVAEDPLRAVARGTGIALKNFDKFTFLIK